MKSPPCQCPSKAHLSMSSQEGSNRPTPPPPPPPVTFAPNRKACSMLVAIAIYMSLSWGAYATFGIGVEGDLLETYPRTGLLTTARICVSMLVTSCYPLQVRRRNNNKERRYLLLVFSGAMLARCCCCCSCCPLENVMRVYARGSFACEPSQRVMFSTSLQSGRQDSGCFFSCPKYCQAFLSFSGVIRRTSPAFLCLSPPVIGLSCNKLQVLLCYIVVSPSLRPLTSSYQALFFLSRRDTWREDERVLHSSRDVVYRRQAPQESSL